MSENEEMNPTVRMLLDIIAGVVLSPNSGMREKWPWQC